MTIYCPYCVWTGVAFDAIDVTIPTTWLRELLGKHIALQYLELFEQKEVPAHGETPVQ